MYSKTFETSPQSNLRRAHHSSVDKTSTRIANYWDCTALACCRHSKRVEPSRKIWLDLALGCVVCALSAVPLQNDCRATALLLLPDRHVAFVLLRFCTWISLQPPLQSWTYVIRKGIWRRIQPCNLRREILSTFHTRVDHRSVRHFCIVFTPKLPLPLRRSPPKVNTPIPSPTPLTTPKRHPDPISRVATAHMWGKTDGTSESSIPCALRS